MRSRHANLIALLCLTVVVATVYFDNRYLSILGTACFMFWLTRAATVVGQIPRPVRTRCEKIACWIIGWPMFATLLVLMAVSVYSMWVLNSPGWMLIIAFFWVLTHLTWKIFIDPDTGPGGWWRHRGGHAPEPPAPVPASPRRSRRSSGPFGTTEQPCCTDSLHLK